MVMIDAGDKSGPMKFKGGICHGGRLDVMWGGEFCTSGFFIAKLATRSNIIKHVLPFSCRLKSCMHLGYHAVKHTVTIICADHAKSKGTITHLNYVIVKWLSPHSINIGVKKRPYSPFKFLGQGITSAVVESWERLAIMWWSWLRLEISHGQGNLKGESAMAATLPSCGEVSYCTSGFFCS